MVEIACITCSNRPRPTAIVGAHTKGRFGRRRPMPDDTRAIEPALSDAEWKQRAIDGMTIEGAYLTVESDEPRDPYRFQPAKVMALANAALPDGDPRKITHDD